MVGVISRRWRSSGEPHPLWHRGVVAAGHKVNSGIRNPPTLRRPHILTIADRSPRSPSQNGALAISCDRSEGGIAAPDEVIEVAVANAGPGPEQQMGTARRPAHRLACIHVLVDDLVDCRLRKPG